MVAVAMQNRFVLHPMVSHPRYFPLAIVSGSKDRYATPEHRRLSIETYVNGRGGVTLAVIFRFHAMIAILVQDRFAVRTVVGCANRPSQRILFILRKIPTVFYRHRLQ